MGVDPFEAGEVIVDISRRLSSWTSDEERFFHCWRVEASLRDEEASEDDSPGEPIGRAQFVVVDVGGLTGTGEGLFNAAEAQDNDDVLTIVTALVFSGSQATDGESTSAVQPDIGLLVVDKVWVDPRFRGHGLGPVLAAVGLEQLLHEYDVAACIPAPIEGERNGPARAAAVEKLGRLWATVGFEPYRDGVWILEPDTATMDDAVRRLVSRLA